MVRYVLDHEDNHIMIEQHVDVIEDLHYSILDSKNQDENLYISNILLSEKRFSLIEMILPNVEQLD
jgi:hypothetical protein